MPKNDNLFIVGEDPQKILGVSEDAVASEIRSAYLNKIKQYPPERCPEEFERVRDAYKILSDPCSRTRIMLRSADPEAPLVTLFDNREKTRRFVGPETWYAAMRER
ncbi:MAG: DnaJ domain-containing protein [Deltaproteobacteria bacterium]|nr:DnaJ domain-containing protein [Deltaproteobacteria bacterium]